MWSFAYESPASIRMVLEAQGMAMRRKFGQNFLLSLPVRKKIVDALDVESGMKVWEIGPGLGALTSLLLERGALVTAFEIDRGFCRVLRECAFRDEAGFTLVEGDALKTMGERADVSERITGNLPYNVGTLVIARILEGVRRPKRMVFTLQKEVAARLTAKSGDRAWSAISILAQTDYEVKRLFDIKAGCFYPEPNVTSSVVLFSRRATSLVSPALRDAFTLVVSDLFAQRRKTIRNNLASGKCGGVLLKDGVARMIDECGLRPSDRAEQLGWEDFLSLAAWYHSFLSSTR